MDEIICSCSKCHKFFDYEQLVRKSRDLYGVTVESKVCPYCGSEGWTSTKDEQWFAKYDKISYVTDKKFSNAEGIKLNRH